ncbi:MULTISPECIES: hypothetical protein [unclassified Sporosarcina]|uniref:hypothetical protein n=1 Tax=unclassified Sporosarcina TaxID=2647733 RepID=UPI001A9331B5|nr:MULTISPECIES: hypothetical protein [unclassified Sporosarcina]MBO0589268.1 hypothetical protein [Sporosarcina sp. E16_8]MBO0601975.1 hypothetical protein [Sporosarcina sp. E16_3]
MKESTATALMFGAALFLALALIGISVNVFSPATEAAKAATTDFSSATTELKDQKYLIYDNTTISGSQVVNALRKFQAEGESGNIAIHVSTGKNKLGEWYYNTFSTAGIGTGGIKPTNINKSTDPEYVNPSGMFKASVERDGNNVIRALYFAQE